MRKSRCRFCGTELTQKFVDLGMSPLSNAYVSSDRLACGEKFYPLYVYVCDQCHLVQLEEFESPEAIFSEYAYFSSYSESWLAHAKLYTEQMQSRFALNSASQVIEIASNDGYLLQYFAEKNIPVLGIEPAKNVAQEAIAKGINTCIAFFGTELAQELVGEGKKADLLIGNNVLAHVPDINDFVSGLNLLLKEHGVITMEFPHLLRLMEGHQFDTIYHEHFSYLSFHTVKQIFDTHSLTVFDVEELSTHGGSLRVFACKKDSRHHAVSHRVAVVLQEETEAGLCDLNCYRDFANDVESLKRDFLSLMIQLKRQGKKIIGYGAPAKGNTLLNYCGVRTDFIDYTVDRNPTKQGAFLPGTHIPVFAPEKIRETKPDYVLILPWNLRDEIIGQISYIREWDGKFIVAIPSVEVIL